MIINSIYETQNLLSGMQEHMLLHTRQSAIQNNKYQSWSCSKAVYKPVWHIPLLSVQWINSWWRTDQLSETYRVSWQNKFVKLVHLIGFITMKQYRVLNHCTARTQVYDSASASWRLRFEVFLSFQVKHADWLIGAWCYQRQELCSEAWGKERRWSARSRLSHYIGHL